MIQVNYEEVALKMREQERARGVTPDAGMDSLLRRVERLERAVSAANQEGRKPRSESRRLTDLVGVRLDTMLHVLGDELADKRGVTLAELLRQLLIRELRGITEGAEE